MEIKNKSNKELIELYKSYNDIIYGDVCCYGKRDLYIYEEICREMNKREEFN